MNKIFSYDLLKGDSEQWDDLPLYLQLCEKNPETYPTGIQIWYGAYMDKIQVEYGSTSMPAHGGSEPGGYKKMVFDKGEYITQIRIDYVPVNNYSNMILQMDTITSKNRKQTYMSWNYDINYDYKVVEFTLPKNCGVVAFSGALKGWGPRTYPCVSGLTVHYKKVGK